MHAIADTLHESMFDPFTSKFSEFFTTEPRDALRNNRQRDPMRSARRVKKESIQLAPRYRVAKMLGAILGLLSSASLNQGRAQI